MIMRFLIVLTFYETLIKDTRSFGLSFWCYGYRVFNLSLFSLSLL